MRDDNGNAAWDLARYRLADADERRRQFLDQELARAQTRTQCRECGEDLGPQNLRGLCRQCGNRGTMRQMRRRAASQAALVKARKALASKAVQERLAEAKRQRDIARARRRLAAKGIET